MNTYIMPHVDGAPDWSAIPVVSLDHPYQHELSDTPVRAFAQAAWSDSALLIHLRAVEPNIRAQYTGDNDEICADSCLEFFFSPVEGDLRYFNVEYNLNCARYLGFGSGLSDLIRLIPDEGNDDFRPAANRTADGWEITYQIPFDFVRRFFPGFTPVRGASMGANFYKCGDCTVQPHWLSWQQLPYDPNRFTFHLPAHFGKLIFG